MPGRPLIRPRAGRQIGGVCLALAQANGWDVTVVRIIAVLGLFFSADSSASPTWLPGLAFPKSTRVCQGPFPPAYKLDV